MDDLDTDGSPDIVLTSDATGLVCGVRELPAGFVHALRTDGQPLRGSWPATLGTFASSSPVIASVAPEGGSR